jgi:hypothetical protein
MPEWHCSTAAQQHCGIAVWKHRVICAASAVPASRCCVACSSCTTCLGHTALVQCCCSCLVLRVRHGSCVAIHAGSPYHLTAPQYCPDGRTQGTPPPRLQQHACSTAAPPVLPSVSAMAVTAITSGIFAGLERVKSMPSFPDATTTVTPAATALQIASLVRSPVLGQLRSSSAGPAPPRLMDITCSRSAPG